MRPSPPNPSAQLADVGRTAECPAPHRSPARSPITTLAGDRHNCWPTTYPSASSQLCGPHGNDANQQIAAASVRVWSPIGGGPMIDETHSRNVSVVCRAPTSVGAPLYLRSWVSSRDALAPGKHANCRAPISAAPPLPINHVGAEFAAGDGSARPGPYQRQTVRFPTPLPTMAWGSTARQWDGSMFPRRRWSMAQSTSENSRSPEQRVVRHA